MCDNIVPAKILFYKRDSFYNSRFAAINTKEIPRSLLNGVVTFESSCFEILSLKENQKRKFLICRVLRINAINFDIGIVKKVSSLWKVAKKNLY